MERCRGLPNATPSQGGPGSGLPPTPTSKHLLLAPKAGGQSTHPRRATDHRHRGKHNMRHPESPPGLRQSNFQSAPPIPDPGSRIPVPQLQAPDRVPRIAGTTEPSGRTACQPGKLQINTLLRNTSSKAVPERSLGEWSWPLGKVSSASQGCWRVEDVGRKAKSSRMDSQQNLLNTQILGPPQTGPIVLPGQEPWSPH